MHQLTGQGYILTYTYMYLHIYILAVHDISYKFACALSKNQSLCFAVSG